MFREKKQAEVLVAYLDKNKHFRFLLAEDELKTLSFEYDERFLVSSQIKEALLKAFPAHLKASSDIFVESGFREESMGKDELSARLPLYYATAEFRSPPKEFWRSLSFREFLDSLTNKRERLTLLKVFQLLSDNKTHLIQAREVSPEELQKEFSSVSNI